MTATTPITRQGQGTPTRHLQLWPLGFALLIALGLPYVIGGDLFTRVTCLLAGAGVFIASFGGRLVPAAAFAASGLVLLAPAAIGERSGRPGLALLIAGAYIASLRGGPKESGSPRSAIVPCLLVGSYWAGAYVLSPVQGLERNLALYFIVAGVALIAFVDRRHLQVQIFRIYSAAIGVMAASSLLTWLVGGAAVGSYSGDLVGRPTFWYLLVRPLTITTGGAPLIPGLDRVSGLAGEPGTWSLMCLVAAACAHFGWANTRVRTGLIAINVLGILAAQSTAALLAFPVAALAAVYLVRARGVARYVGAPAVIGGLLLTLPVASHLLQGKLAVNEASFTDRGFILIGGRISAVGGGASRISVLASFGTDGLLTLLLVVALIISTFMARRSSVVLAVTLAFAAISFATQPVQYHVGLWAMIALLIAFSRSEPSDQSRAVA